MIRFKDGPPFQTALVKRPFWMLVGCSLVNLTNWIKAKPVFQEMFRRSAGDPTWFTEVDALELQELLKPLGLWRNRAKALPRMAVHYIETPPRDFRDVPSIPGCGKYASDSWAIFIDRTPELVRPTDRILLRYLEEMK